MRGLPRPVEGVLADQEVKGVKEWLTRNLPALIPVVPHPEDANTSVHTSSIGGGSTVSRVAHNRQLGCRLTATFDAQAARLPGASKA
jgi:hypothetical protein